MAELKTKQHDGDVLSFIKSFANTDQKQEDSLKLIEIMEKLSGHPPKMWGTSMIGFGSYHYKSDRSTQEGDWLLVGFSPRKAAISLYVFSGSPEHEYLLEGLGKFKRGKACLYINKLSDINQEALEKLILETIDFYSKRYEVHAS
ncbi:MAG: DUF1801 domain-containing protein [Erysipelothrix sp.]|jgi:hypothetical protein|nr:DUF1801 domain-containing protein [Erysipelothrix sp.]